MQAVSAGGAHDHCTYWPASRLARVTGQTLTADAATTAHGRDIYRFSGQVSPATGNKQAGGSIRCIKSE